MLKKIITKLLRHRHPWRDISFDELSEIYVTMMFRSMALSMNGVFVPIYLYKLAYTPTLIFMVFAVYFSARIIMDFGAAFSTAKIGPKHTLIIGQFLQIISSSLFLTLPKMHWPIILLGFVWGSAASFFFIPFHVDFSKVKHKIHGGKELGFEQITEKIGVIVGPFLGGLVASLFGSRYIFLVAIGLLFGGLWPLLMTKEPTNTNQKLNFKNFPVNKIKPYLPAYIAINLENTICIMLWPLFLAVFVIPGNSVFYKVGIISSFSVVAAIFSAIAIGKIVDNNKGRNLLRYSALSNAVIHLFRPFVASYPLAFGINVINETVTIGYKLPFNKGHYDAADDLPGYRIVFISSMEVIGCIAKASFWWILVMLSLISSSRILYIIGFYTASLASLAILSEKYKSLVELCNNQP